MALTLPNLDPNECLDFAVGFGDLLAPGAVIQSATVEIESAAPAESPLPNLQYGSPFVYLDQEAPQNSPLQPDTVVFWLEGSNGTLNTKYTFRVTVLDDSTPQRCHVRRVVVKVKEK